MNFQITDSESRIKTKSKKSKTKMKKNLIFLGIAIIISIAVSILMNYEKYYLETIVTNDYGRALGNLLFSQTAFKTYITVSIIVFFSLKGIEKAIYYGTKKRENEIKNEE